MRSAIAVRRVCLLSYRFGLRFAGFASAGTRHNRFTVPVLPSMPNSWQFLAIRGEMGHDGACLRVSLIVYTSGWHCLPRRIFSELS